MAKKRKRPLRRKSKSRRKSPSPQLPTDDRFEVAFGLLRSGHSQRKAAAAVGISASRFRRLIQSNKLATFKGGRWRITDRRKREVTLISQGKERIVMVRGFAGASLAMRHRAAVRKFLETNDASLLEPFKGLAVTDTAKRQHLLETRPNVLYRLANAGNDAEMKIYRLIQ